MINIILKDIVSYKVEVPLLWLVGFLFLVYKLGYEVSKKKYSPKSSQNQTVESIMPYKTDF